MNFQVRRWRLVLRLLVLAIIVGTIPWPCSADQPGAPAKGPGLRASIGRAVAALPMRDATPARAKAQTGDAKAQLESKSFFKTTPGVIVLAVMAAGTGYAFYSANHDRIPKNANR